MYTTDLSKPVRAHVKTHTPSSIKLGDVLTVCPSLTFLDAISFLIGYRGRISELVGSTLVPTLLERLCRVQEANTGRTRRL